MEKRMTLAVRDDAEHEQAVSLPQVELWLHPISGGVGLYARVQGDQFGWRVLTIYEDGTFDRQTGLPAPFSVEKANRQRITER